MTERSGHDEPGRTDRRIQEIVDACPPLRPEQIERLRALLRPLVQRERDVH